MAPARKESSREAKAEKIDRLLTNHYGRYELPARRPDPLDTLIETILSQNTSDLNSHRAFRELKKAYPSWNSLLGEDPKRVAKIIKKGGLAQIKSGRILDSLKFIKSERGSLSLAFLKGMDRVDAEAWLARMKGVGPKTRAIVILFALGKPMFPVDTHIIRVTKRLGLVPKKMSREDAQEWLASLVDEREYYNFHIVLIEHGRTICVARGPKCGICPVTRLCQYYHEVYLPQKRLKGQT